MEKTGAVPKKPLSTRSVTKHWFFGQYVNDISANYLPLKIDAIRLYLFKRHEMEKVRFSEKEKTAITNEIAIKFIKIWTEASLPVKSEKAVKLQIKREIFEILSHIERETPNTVSEIWKTEMIEDT